MSGSKERANARLREKLSNLRVCGQCRACCTAMEVVEIGKLSGVHCEHLRPAPAKGCGIYETRPEGCREWKCTWLNEPNTLMGSERPDRLGAIFDARDSSDLGYPVVLCREVREGAFQELAVRVVIARLVGRGNLVLLISGSEPDIVVHDAQGPQDKLDEYREYRERQAT